LPNFSSRRAGSRRPAPFTNGFTNSGEIVMAENTEPTNDATEEAEEVEAHSVLDNQGLGKDMDKSESACISTVSSIESK
jgi:hypothetical protein